MWLKYKSLKPNILKQSYKADRTEMNGQIYMNKIVHNFKVTGVFLYSQSNVKRTMDRGIASCDYTQVIT